MRTSQEWQAFRMPVPPKIASYRILSSKTPISVLSDPETSWYSNAFASSDLIEVACDAREPDDDPETMYQMARYYHLEKGDLSLAETWYKVAAETGHAEACFHLGFLYETRLPDFHLAQRFYKEAFKNGHLKASNNLALLIWKENGPTVEVESLLFLSHQQSNLYSTGALVLFYEETGDTQNMLYYADQFFQKVSVDSAIIKPLGLVMDRLLKHKQFDYLHRKFQDPDLQLMKLALPYWHVLEILRSNLEIENRKGL